MLQWTISGTLSFHCLISTEDSLLLSNLPYSNALSTYVLFILPLQVGSRFKNSHVEGFIALYNIDSAEFIPIDG